MPEIHGHRGARALRPENTLAGLAYALAIGVDAIEFDVTLTADGGLILAHDPVVSAPTIFDTRPATEGDPHFPYVGKRWSALTLPQIGDIADYIHSFRVGGYDISRNQPLTILVGDAAAGAEYFKTTCASCHSVTGDLKGIGSRFDDPKQLQNYFLMPGGGRG